MASNLEYAQLSTHVYHRSDANRTPLTSGWSEIAREAGGALTGFEAGAYRKGNEVVISFAGTNGAGDWGSNIPGGFGLGAEQITHAVDFALRVMAQNPGAAFSFTGHSLGGGFASVMAVFFDLSATVFDEAPFELSARNPIVLGALQLYLINSGYSNSKFDEYTATLGSQFSEREKKVISYNVDGEVLETIRHAGTAIYGASQEYSIGSPSALSGALMTVSLHSMDLMSSVMRSSAFNEGLQKQNRAFGVFCDDSLYASDTRSGKNDFLALMHNKHLRSSAAGSWDNALDVIGADLQKIGVSGTVNEKKINEGVLAALAEYYYFCKDASLPNFVASLAGGIELDYEKISQDTDHKGQVRLSVNLKDWLAEKGVKVETSDFKRVVLQSGASPLSSGAHSDDRKDLLVGGSGDDNADGGSGDDILVGLGGMDILRGGEGNDKIYGGEQKDILHGDDGNDELWGDEGGDELYGGGGRDVLEGGAGADKLYGGAGYDLYVANSQDIISDEDGVGKVFHEKHGILSGGSRKKSDPENIYKNGNLTYFLDSNILWFGGLKIENFKNHDLGIHLKDEDDDDDKDPPNPEQAENRTSPLVIDLDGDGVETLAYSRNVYFDHDANGFKESTAWAGSDDGILVRDLDGDGDISTGRELFGNQTVKADGSKALNGFDALRELDSNQDSKVDASDAAFAELKVWRDANGDAIVQEGELKSLSEVGIRFISTAYTNSSLVDAQGQAHRELGSVTKTDGTTADVHDIWFKVDAGRRINAVSFDWDPDAVDLPDAVAFGNLMDLRQTIGSNNVLKEKVQAFIVAPDAAARKQMMEGLIFEWAGVTNVDPKSRDPKKVYGHVMDARQLIVIEQLIGRGYLGTWCWGEKDPNPHGNAAPLLIAEFKKFEGYIYAQLSAQINPSRYGFIKGGFDSGSTNFVVDWAECEAAFKAARASNDLAAVKEMAEVMKGLGTYSNWFRGHVNSVFAEVVAAYPDVAPIFDNMSIIGTDSSEYLYGDNSNQVVYGGKGDDILNGGGGDDVYFYRGGDGNDRVYDSGGIDRISFMEGIVAQQVTVTRDLSSLILNITHPDGNGFIKIERVFDENGHVLDGVVESVKFANGTVWSFDDLLAMAATSATQGDDKLYGTVNADSITALAGDDLVLGLDGDDVLDGGVGNDTIQGGNGNDRLIGGQGDMTSRVGTVAIHMCFLRASERIASTIWILPLAGLIGSCSTNRFRQHL